MLLTSHDLEELALAPVAEAGEDAGSDSDDGTAFLLDLTQDVDTEFLDLILVDVDVHDEPPFVKGLMGQEILQALSLPVLHPDLGLRTRLSCMVLEASLVAGSVENSLLNP